MAKVSFGNDDSGRAWAKLFRVKRTTLKLSRQKLANTVNISPSLISKIESGLHDPRDMSMGRLMAFMRALRITPEELGLSSFTALVGSGTITVQAYPSLNAACVNEGAVPGYLDPRTLPPSGNPENFALVPYLAAVNSPPILVAENLPLKAGSWLIIERGQLTDDKLMLGYLAETRQPIIFHWRYNLEPTLLRPATGVGQVYWLGPDGSLEVAGSFSRLRPLIIGPIHSEIRHF
jgi:transcriptional regulator with XRE-family HTH domain